MPKSPPRPSFGQASGMAAVLLAVGMFSITLTSNGPLHFPRLQKTAAALASLGAVILAAECRRIRTAPAALLCLLCTAVAAQMWWGAFNDNTYRRMVASSGGGHNPQQEIARANHAVKLEASNRQMRQRMPATR